MIVLRSDFLPKGLLERVDREWPDASWSGWHQYSDAHHSKAASGSDARMPPAIAVALARMAAAPLWLWLESPGIVPDLSLWGGGVHEMKRGQSVGRHLDAEVHPRLGLARAASMVLYVHPRWEGRWGGQLRIVGRSIVPASNLLVAMARGPDAWHGVERVECPDGASRRSLALWWYSPEAPVGGSGRARFQGAP